MADSNLSLSERVAIELAKGDLDLTRSPALANVPTPGDDIVSLKKSIVAIKTILDAKTGTGGSAYDQWVSTRDLINAGTINLTVSPSNVIGTVPVPDFADPDPRPFLTTPPTPTNLTAQGSYKHVILSWDLTAYRNHSYTEVWRATVNSLASASVIAQAEANLYADDTAAMGTVYYYWVRAVGYSTDGSAITGAFNGVGGTMGGLGLIGNVDLGPLIVEAGNLASGAVTASKIAANAVDLTKFASGIQPVSIVSSVPGSFTTNTIFNTTDAKIYRWDGAAYTAAVITADLNAQVTNAQIAALAASKITGTLTDSQIADLAATKITGQITTTQITDDAVTTPKLLAGAVTAGKIAANTITASQIAANTITAGQIAANTITASQIAANTITAGQIAANTITASQIAANTITASQIAADTITAGQIAAGAIGASEIAANAVTTGKLLVTGQGKALNDDPTGIDVTAWTVVSGAIASVADTSAPVGAYSLQTSATYTEIYSRRFPIEAGKTYKVSAWVKQSGGGQIYLRLICVDGAGTNVNYTVTGISPIGTFENVTPASSSWIKYIGYIVAGSGSVSAELHAYLLWTTGGNAAITDFRCEEYIGADLIVDGAIIAGKIAAGAIAVGSAAIENGAIRNALIENLAVDDAKIANATISYGKIASVDAGTITVGTLSAGRIATGSLDANKITSNTITATQIAAGTITATQIAANTITATQIAAGTITATEIAASTITSGKLNVTSLSSVTTETGTLVVGTSGYVRGGQTAWATGTGFFMGYSGGEYKLSIGDASTYLKFSSAGLEIKLDTYTVSVSGGGIIGLTGNGTQSLGTVTATVSGGVSPYTYTWDITSDADTSTPEKFTAWRSVSSSATYQSETIVRSTAGALAPVSQYVGQTCTVTDANGRTAIGGAPLRVDWNGGTP